MLFRSYQDSDRYRRISAQGQFVFAEQLLVRKSVVNGSVGFNVMTPFVTDTGVRLYVIRGWTDTPPQRTATASPVPLQVVLRIDAVRPNGDMRPNDLPAGEINWVDPLALAAGKPTSPAVFDLVEPVVNTKASPVYSMSRLETFWSVLMQVAELPARSVAVHAMVWQPGASVTVSPAGVWPLIFQVSVAPQLLKAVASVRFTTAGTGS